MITFTLTITIIILLIGCCSNSMKTLNPVKIATIVALSGSIIFCYLRITKGTSWIYILILILFLGGIMIVFMIISSLAPNEPSLPSKSTFWISIVTLIAMITQVSRDGRRQMKWFAMSTQNIRFIVIMVLRYFVVFIWIVSMESCSMRTWSCCCVREFFVKIRIKNGNYYCTKRLKNRKNY